MIPPAMYAIPHRPRILFLEGAHTLWTLKHNLNGIDMVLQLCVIVLHYFAAQSDMK